MPNRTPIQAAIAASILISTPIQAQDETAVEPVVVTATRTAQTADETVAPVTVITREEIQASGARTVPDALAGQAGIDLSRNGGPGTSTSVNLRGLGDGKVLFLVNGMRIGDPSSVDGAPSVQHIPTSQIERIEIVRGPRSTLYGSEALGGVINIITREPDESRFEASVGAGTYDSREANATVSGRNEALGYTLSVSRFDTEGYDIRDDDFDDKDGYDNTSASGRVSYDATDRLSLNLDFLADQGTTEFDNCSDSSSFGGPYFGDCHTDFKQRTMGIGADYQVNQRWDTSLRFNRSREERRNFYQDTFNNEFDGTTNTVSWQNDIQVASSHLLTLGIDGARDSVAQPSNFERDERDRMAVFGQWQAHAGAHDLVLGARRIDDEQFGGHSTGSIDYGFQAAEGLRVLASAGTAFKAPTLFQLYSPQYGNDELAPEKSATVEFGLSGDTDWGDWSVRTYRTDARDLINFANQSYDNVDEVRIDGLEVEAGAQIAAWDTGMSYSWSEPIDQETGEALANTAERTFRLSMDRDFGAWNTGGSIVAQSRRSGGSFSDPVAGYGILNLNAGYQLAQDWRIRGTLDNVLDHDYQTNDAYIAPGRTAFVHLEYRPDSG